MAINEQFVFEPFCFVQTEVVQKLRPETVSTRLRVQGGDIVPFK